MFREATAETGLSFWHRRGLPCRYRFPEIMGCGGALLDFDNDGDLDVYLVDMLFDDELAEAQVHPERHGNRLFEQIAPLRFHDVTTGSGLEDVGLGQGVAVGDVNNDGLPDLYLTKIGPDRLFLNRGQGRFEDVTVEAKTDNPLWGTSCSFFDYDRDGWLDLYVANYVEFAPRECRPLAGGSADYCSPKQFAPSADRLFRNLGRSHARGSGTAPVRFADVTAPAGIAIQASPGLGVACADFNSDGWPDIHVANDQAANFLWINDRAGRFQDEAVLRGSAYDPLGQAQAGMGVAIADVDANGEWDLFESHLSGERNALYLGRSGQFANATIAAGLGDPSLTRTGFGTAFSDLDHDGEQDVLVVNGAVRRADSVKALAPVEHFGDLAACRSFLAQYQERNQIFLNVGNGQFRLAISRNDPFLSQASVSRGLLVGDLDNDGDDDLIVTRVGEPAQLFVNESQKLGHWLRLRLLTSAAGDDQRPRDDLGAVVEIKVRAKTWRRLLQPATGYLTSHDPRVHFGLGDVTRVEQVAVTWSDGVREDFVDLNVDRIVTLTKGTGHRHE